jgi:two-component system, NtrC family, nitrogen regulation sensor histidine kinase NtrY
MKFKLPSIRIQFLILVQFLLIFSVLFYRFYFIQNFDHYEETINSLDFEGTLNTVYQNNKEFIPEIQFNDFKQDFEGLLGNIKERQFAADSFRNEMELYSIYILTFIIIFVFLFTIFTFKLITGPLERLQSATQKLSRGNLSIQIPESKYSPLNELILSFNSMVNELDQTRSKLIATEKDTVWREMARAMAHEIKNPLTPLQLTSERLEMKYLESHEDVLKILPRSLEIIKEEISNLKRLTVEFTKFARLPKAEPDEFNLSECILDIVKSYENDANIQFKTEYSQDVIYADKFQLRQVLVNIIQNGIQACDENPEINIYVEEKNKGYVSIYVSDNGKGIPEKEISMIFEPYFSKRKKGTGLGLAIVKKIIEQHGGDISVDSTVNVGSTFCINLPIYKSND